MTYRIKKCRGIRGEISLPGDKSISHRALLLCSIAKGISGISNLSPCQDVLSTRQCMEELGIKFIPKTDSIKVVGSGLYGLQPSSRVLNAGNSGTTVRLLSGILAAQPFQTVIIGDKYLSQRPMDRIIVPLQKMGADIKGQQDRYLPLRIRGKPLSPLHYDSPVASAQIKSCILLAGLYTDGEVSVRESFTSRDHTERMLKHFGVTVKQNHTTRILTKEKKLPATEIKIPGDISSAAFFIIAALLLRNSHLTLTNIGINPTRTGILSVLKEMGADISYTNQQYFNLEPVAHIHVSSQKLRATTVKNPLIPQIIDEIPILAVAATQARGSTEIRNAEELRVKETDRIKAVYVNLKAMGAEVRELEDGLVIRGPVDLKGAEINTYGDHRIAMAFTIAGLLAKGTTIIPNSECAEISFPGFYRTLENLYV